MAQESVQVVVAFGSNLGDSASLIGGAMDRIEERSGRPLRRSSLWTSTPVDCPPDAPVFINAVAILEPLPGETPESLLDFMQELEVAAGRRPKVVHNESRPLDLDLIAWCGQTRSMPRLVLPHPRARERRFVLQPLAELESGFRFDGDGEPITSLLENLPPDDRLRVVAPAPARSGDRSAARD
jgi:2-amino-4-hydroxy-6-hydroxymethyldihydropteridine diphosphokinase